VFKVKISLLVYSLTKVTPIIRSKRHGV